MSIYQIYLITNDLNDKKYVGQHKLTKWTLQREYMGSGVALKAAQVKYGLAHFKKTIIEEIEDDEKHELTSEREKYWIAYYDCIAPNGYNISPGGEGGSTSEISQRAAETRKLHGYRHTDATRQKISEANKGKKFTDVHRQHLSDNHHLKTLHKIQFENGDVIESSESLGSIAKIYDVNQTTLIRHSAKGQYTNGIMLLNIDPNKYACCSGGQHRLTKLAKDYKYKDPITGEIINYTTLINRRKRNPEYKQFTIKESRIEENADKENRDAH